MECAQVIIGDVLLYASPLFYFLKVLIDNKADLNAVDAAGRFPIHSALHFDSPEVVHTLIQGKISLCLTGAF